MSSQFDEPDESGGARIYPKDVLGHLLIVWAVDYIAHSPTQFSRPDKPSDVVVVDVVDLDQVDPDSGAPGLVSRRTWWRQSQLIASLKRKVGTGTPMLARMGKGTATMGQPPFVLNSMTADPQCVQRANAWFQNHPDFKPSEPMPQTPAAEEEPPEADAWFAPDAASATVGNGPAILNYGPPPGHQESLRNVGRPETQLEAMARRSQLPPTRPTPDEPPY